MPPADQTARAARPAAYDAGPALVDRLGSASASGTRAVWSAAPATSWQADAAALVGEVLAHPEGGVIVVVPDAADVDRVLGEVGEARKAGVVAVLTSDQGPERRYREFVRGCGRARLVVGTRRGVRPHAHLRLVIVDDGNDSLLDPQAPYWDARDITTSART